MAFHFERVSLAALPANLAALPAYRRRDVDRHAERRRGPGPRRSRRVLNGLNGFCLAYVAAVAHWGARLPGACSRFASGAARLGVAYAAPGGARSGRLARRCPTAAPAAAVLALASRRRAAAGGRPAPPRDFTVTFLDVGQGDATLIQAPGGHAALVDGGPPGAGIVSKLQAAGRPGSTSSCSPTPRRTTRAGSRRSWSGCRWACSSTAGIGETAPITGGSWRWPLARRPGRPRPPRGSASASGGAAARRACAARARGTRGRGSERRAAVLRVSYGGWTCCCRPTPRAT